MRVESGPPPTVEVATSPEQQLVDGTAADVAAHVAEALAPSTRRGYAAAWRRFTQWCDEQQVSSLPADSYTVAAFLSDHEQVRNRHGLPRWQPATLTLWVAAIARAHRQAGYPSPCGPGSVAADTLAGIRRERGVRPRRVKPAGLVEVKLMLDAMDVEHWPDVIKSTRDAAILLVGLAGAMRRSELAGLDIADAEPQPDGSVHLLVARSKTDQEGVGMVKYLPRGQHPETCPACALWRWVRLVRLADSGRARAVVIATATSSARGQHVCQDSWVMQQWTGKEKAPLFRSVHKSGQIATEPAAGDVPERAPARSRFARPGRYSAMTGQAIHQMLRQRAAAAGLNPALFGGHSLRAGFVTDALGAGADTTAVKRQTGHKSDSSLAVYDRDHTPGRNNAATQLGF